MKRQQQMQYIKAARRNHKMPLRFPPPAPETERHRIYGLLWKQAYVCSCVLAPGLHAMIKVIWPLRIHHFASDSRAEEYRGWAVQPQWTGSVEAAEILFWLR